MLMIIDIQVKESLFCLTLEHIDFHIIDLLDVKHMVILTHFFRGNPLSPHRLLFPISIKRSFICTFPQRRTAHTTDFDGPVVDPWLGWKKAQTAHIHTGFELTYIHRVDNFALDFVHGNLVF